MVASGVRLEDGKGGFKCYYLFTFYWISGGQPGLEPSLILNLVFFPSTIRFGAPPGHGSASCLCSLPSAPCIAFYYMGLTYNCITITVKATGDLNGKEILKKGIYVYI